MKQGILIVTWAEGAEQASNLLQSMAGVKYPILLVINAYKDKIKLEVPPGLWDHLTIFEQPKDTFELGAIQITLNITDWDEFILLQDTFEIIDISIFDILFNNYPGRSVSYNPHFQMYLGKFRREALQKIHIPTASHKIDSIYLEHEFTDNYKRVEVVEVFNPNFRDENFYGSYEEKWGRKNLVMKDQYLIKRKGTWNKDQLMEISDSLGLKDWKYVEVEE